MNMEIEKFYRSHDILHIIRILKSMIKVKQSSKKNREISLNYAPYVVTVFQETANCSVPFP